MACRRAAADGAETSSGPDETGDADVRFASIEFGNVEARIVHRPASFAVDTMTMEAREVSSSRIGSAGAEGLRARCDRIDIGSSCGCRSACGIGRRLFGRGP